MLKEQFQVIENNLKERVINCKHFLGNIKTTEDLKKITIGELQELHKFCKKELSQMTQICMVDLYHLIGMGNLTVVQLNSVIKLFKEYISYRSDMKALAINLNSISNLPKIPVNSKYTLLQLGGITLYSNPDNTENAVEDIEHINDFGNAKNIEKISLDGNKLTLSVDSVNSFLKKINNWDGITADKIKQAAKAQGKYMGIEWSFDSTQTIITGVIISSAVKDQLAKLI